MREGFVRRGVGGREGAARLAGRGRTVVEIVPFFGVYGRQGRERETKDGGWRGREKGNGRGRDEETRWGVRAPRAFRHG